MAKEDAKKIFLIATGDRDLSRQISSWINEKFLNSVVYHAADFFEAVAKLKNVPPHLLITDLDLPKAKPGDLIDHVLSSEKLKSAIITMNGRPISAKHMDAVAIGRMHFISKVDIETFREAVMKVSNYAFNSEIREFKLKILRPGEILIREGDSCKNVYIVRKGELNVYRDQSNGEKIHIGKVFTGEFVGEMAYFIGNKRVASVEAITDCEVIEIPPQSFEKVIYKRPSWVKTLFETLSRRLLKIMDAGKEKNQG